LSAHFRLRNGDNYPAIKEAARSSLGRQIFHSGAILRSAERKEAAALTIARAICKAAAGLKRRFAEAAISAAAESEADIRGGARHRPGRNEILDLVKSKIRVRANMSGRVRLVEQLNCQSKMICSLDQKFNARIFTVRHQTPPGS